MRLKSGFLKNHSGFVSTAGFLGIAVCLVFFGGIVVLVRLIWPELSTFWLILIAFGTTTLALFILIFLQPYEKKMKRIKK